MTIAHLSDAHLVCATCGGGFVFSAGEQELYRIRGVSQQPDRCPPCTRSHTATPRPATTLGR